jgi:hypothetical protein
MRHRHRRHTERPSPRQCCRSCGVKDGKPHKPTCPLQPPQPTPEQEAILEKPW